MELYGFMEREKKIPSYFFIITKQSFSLCLPNEIDALLMVNHLP